MANLLSRIKDTYTAISKGYTFYGGGNGQYNNGIRFWGNGSETKWATIGHDNTAYYLSACPALTTIIGRKAQAFINGKVEVLNFNTDNYVRGRHKEWERLMRNPNPLQTYREFMAQVYMYIQAYKFCPIVVIRPTGFDDKTIPSQLWVLPPQFLKIETNEKYLFVDSYMDMVDKIEFIYEGKTSELNKDNIFILRGLGMNMENLVFPDSALAPLKYPIQNIIKNYEARGTIAEKRGAIGILSNSRGDSISSLPLRKGEKEALQEDYKKYGMGKDQWQLIITNASLSYQSMVMPIKDMMLLEMEKADVMAIADAFNYPSVLLASEKGTTYSNQEGAKRSFYQDTIVPEAMHIEEQLNRMLYTEQNGVKITLDYTWLPILQMDEKLKSQVRRELGLAVIYEFRNNVITWNEMKIALGQDTVAGRDKYFYELTEMYGIEQEGQPVNGARVEDPDRQGTIENEGGEREDD